MREFKLLRLAFFSRATMVGAVTLFVAVVAACSSGTSVPDDPQEPGSNSPDPAQAVGEVEVPEFDASAFTEINPLPEIRAFDRDFDFRGEIENYEDNRIPRDAINPVYSPVFVSPDEATLRPKELVMGLEINGDARAYPVGMMRIREMVNDEVGGTPVLVTW